MLKPTTPKHQNYAKTLQVQATLQQPCRGASVLTRTLTHGDDRSGHNHSAFGLTCKKRLVAPLASRNLDCVIRSLTSQSPKYNTYSVYGSISDHASPEVAHEGAGSKAVFPNALGIGNRLLPDGTPLAFSMAAALMLRAEIGSGSRARG